MFGNSTPVRSNQDGTHPHLINLLERHRQAWRKPVSAHTRQAFEQACAYWEAAGRPPLVLDAACGTGASTLQLAGQWPDHLVIGVDQSADRLARGPAAHAGSPDNLLLVRADVADFWRLLADAGMRLARHYLLYPNPWPRKQHVQRRWHGHPAFPLLLELGGQLECRSNWKTYVDELAIALQHLAAGVVLVDAVPEGLPLTPFEKKYRASGHALWRCRCALTQPG